MTAKISMKLAEKLIRLEQGTVASLKNENITYKQTEYYKSLSDEDKERFEKHLRQKRRLPKIFAVSIILPLFFFALTKISFTGNVIAENLDRSKLSSFGIFFLALFLCSFAFFGYYLISKKNFEKTFARDSYVMDDLLASKATIRRY